jgi:hypothetical protein
MNRRLFLQLSSAALLTATYSAYALASSGTSNLTIAVFPGTGAEEVPIYAFQASTHAMTEVLTKKIGKKVYTEPFRSFTLLRKTLDSNAADALLVPPIIAAYAFQHGYQPLVRIQDMASGALIKRKGQAVTRIGITEHDSWLGAMGMDLIAQHKLVASNMLEVVKTQDAVVYLLQQKVVQAAVLRSEKANKLIATGEYELWYPLASTPDLTLLIHDKFASNYAEPLRKAMLDLPADAINGLQEVIHVPIKQFVTCTKQDYVPLTGLLK